MGSPGMAGADTVGAVMDERQRRMRARNRALLLVLLALVALFYAITVVRIGGG
jgi:hypothetical protein